jgi:hypothetical protein
MKRSLHSSGMRPTKMLFPVQVLHCSNLNKSNQMIDASLKIILCLKFSSRVEPVTALMQAM